MRPTRLRAARGSPILEAIQQPQVIAARARIAAPPERQGTILKYKADRGPIAFVLVMFAVHVALFWWATPWVALAAVLPLAYLPEVLGLSADTARVLPFRAATDFLHQVREFGRHLATAVWPTYNTGALFGAILAIVGLPALAAAVFTRLDITD